MEQAELTLRYRELDRDCALLSYRMHGPNEFEPKLFIPDEEAVAGVREAWRELGRRVEELADHFGTIDRYIIESLKYATIHAPEEDGTPKEDFADDEIRAKYIEKFMKTTRENRLKAGKPLLRGLRFINNHAQELKMMPLLKLDPALLEQPLYH